MRIGVLGTGMVGRALAGRLAGLGHEVRIGTRDMGATLARTQPDAMGTPAYPIWQAEHPTVRLSTLGTAAGESELVINATHGAASLELLDIAGAANLAGKVLLDIALALDFSAGMPPRQLIGNTDSLGEQIQRAFPDARVVKSLSTVFCEVMVDPSRVPGRHNIFIAGNDPSAKVAVLQLLTSFGWPDGSVIDLGGITTAGAAEMYMPLYFTLAHLLGHFDFNIALIDGRRPETT